jgi:type II secretory pathway component PulF
VDLLESGASDTEIQLHFGQRESLEDRLLRLTKEQRRQYAFYTTRLSSRMALWWILILRQHQNSHRKALQTGLSNPLLLMGLSYGMIVLLNHVMYPRINTLFPLESKLNSPSLAIGLNLLEVIYTGLLCAILLWVFMPARFRLRLMTNHFQHPALSGIRLIIRHRFMTMLIQAMAKGVSIHDLLFILGHGDDHLLRDVALRINADLIRGLPLSEALVHMDPHLKHLIVFHDPDHPLDVQLSRYAALQTLRFRSMVKRLRNGLLGCAYVSFGFIMVSAYQMMFEPIRRLEQWL